MKPHLGNKIFVGVLFTVASINLSSCEPKEGADNVCINQILERRSAIVDVPVQYPVEYEKSCHGLLSCRKAEFKTKIDKRIETVVIKVDRRACCPGYAETPAGLCSPICLQSCNNGRCIAPNQCECNSEPNEVSPGFVGSKCDRFVCLRPNRWGSHCDKECNCNENSYCSASTGKCICRGGWTGSNCTEECLPSMRCDNLELPPILEPEANIISETSIKDRSQNMNLPEALERAAGQIQEDVERTDSQRQFYSIQSLIHFIVISILLSTLLYFWYRFEKLKTLVRNQAYGYGYASSSIYSNGTQGSSSINDGSIQGGDSPKYATIEKGPKKFIERYLIHPRVESHLAESHQTSKQNLYSDIYIPIGSEKKSADTNSPGRAVNESMTSSNQDDHEYQVPRSISSPKPTTQDIMSRPLPTPGYQFEDPSNIYEEIKPRSPPQHK